MDFLTSEKKQCCQLVTSELIVIISYVSICGPCKLTVLHINTAHE